jgi:flagellar motor protein MotB
MNDEIKSAREIAMEKIAALDAVTPEDKLKWKFVPEGEQAALRYFKDGADMAASISGYPREAQPFVRTGAEEVLLSNIQIPSGKAIEDRNKKSMDGLLTVKTDKNAINKLLNQMKQILAHYTDQGAQQRKETYEALKQQYEVKLKKAVGKQLGSKADTDLGISVDTLPQFQEEWRRASAQMDEQYIKLIDEFKKELRKIK